MIAFESYMTPSVDQKGFDFVDFPSSEFPLKFSRLFIPFRKSQSIELPPGVVLPKDPMFIDIYTFDITEAEVQKKKTPKHANEMKQFSYTIKDLTFKNGPYLFELEGRYEDFKFNHIPVETLADKTRIIRIRLTNARTLYLALTAIAPLNMNLREVKGITPPKVIETPPPRFDAHHPFAKVRIRAVITAEGKVDGDNMILLECPAYLFARNSLDVVLNKWTFVPATKDKSPIDFEINIRINFPQYPGR